MQAASLCPFVRRPLIASMVPLPAACIAAGAAPVCSLSIESLHNASKDPRVAQPPCTRKTAPRGST